jgi:DNA mismatch endonuclease, patch repair protein
VLLVAVFVDGAFWHGHPSRHRPGRSGRYWDEKIARNIARDRAVDAELRNRGWEVLRIWDFEVRKELDFVVSRVVDLLKDRIGGRVEAAWQRHLLDVDSV